MNPRLPAGSGCVVQWHVRHCGAQAAVHCLVLHNDDTAGLQTGRLVLSATLLVSASRLNIQDVCC